MSECRRGIKSSSLCILNEGGGLVASVRPETFSRLHTYPFHDGSDVASPV